MRFMQSFVYLLITECAFRCLCLCLCETQTWYFCIFWFYLFLHFAYCYWETDECEFV